MWKIRELGVTWAQNRIQFVDNKLIVMKRTELIHQIISIKAYNPITGELLWINYFIGLIHLKLVASLSVIDEKYSSFMLPLKSCCVKLSIYNV